MKTLESDRLREIEVNQARLRADIQQSQRLIDESCELLDKHRNGRTSKAGSDGGEPVAS